MIVYIERFSELENHLPTDNWPLIEFDEEHTCTVMLKWVTITLMFSPLNRLRLDGGQPHSTHNN